MITVAQDPLKEWFRTNLRWWRRTRQLTQVQLAERLEIAAPGISQLESGDWVPGLDVVARVAEALGVKSAQLLCAPVEEKSPAGA